ncbi:MAG: hypothetical protein AB1646_02360 [Thermodesulfobacteriota bacterium]
MRTFITVVVIVLAIVFVGGALNLGGRPLFGHMDRILGTQAFMKIHRSCFFFLYRGHGTMDAGVDKTKSDLDEFGKRPIGIDRKKQYEDLDEASKN